MKRCAQLKNIVTSFIEPAVIKKYFNYYKKIAAVFRKIENINAIIKKEQAVFFFENKAFESDEIGTTSELISDNQIMVSLTTHGTRIHEVHLAIESMMHQTLMPNRIVLWLGKQYENSKLPVLLKKQQRRGLEICYCEDLGPHTKLVPSLIHFPNSVIITIDDDMIYSSDFIEGLVNSYKSDPSKIYFYRGHRILFKNQKKIAPYSDWAHKGAYGSSLYNLPTGVGGVLYPPKCFHTDVCDRKLILSLCPHADDIWFKVMSLLNGVECCIIEKGANVDDKFIYIDTAVGQSLSNLNNLKKMNDVQIKAVFDHYKIGPNFF